MLTRTIWISVSAVIAAIRLGLFWFSLNLYAGTSGERQVVGFFLLAPNSIVEFALAALVSGRRPAPPSVAAALIVMTSALLGGGLTWLWSEFRRR